MARGRQWLWAAGALGVVSCAAWHHYQICRRVGRLRPMVESRALNLLEPDQRAVVVLVDIQEMNYEEAAQVLRIPVGTVKSRLARARLRLRQILEPVRDIEYSAALAGTMIAD